MAFTVMFRSQAPSPPRSALEAWLTDQGEPFEAAGGELSLRALPIRLVVDEGVRAHLDPTPTCPLTRLVRVVFDLSVHLGADVRLVGSGPVTRASLWLHLADEQDRQRIAAALEEADRNHPQDDVRAAFWSLLGALGDGRDLRWDASRAAIVEMRDVGGDGGLTVEEASWHNADAAIGDTVPIQVGGAVHILAWRWLSEAWPSLLDR